MGANLVDDSLRLGVEGLYASGNDVGTGRAEGWNQLFPTGHKFLGLTDAFGARTNVASGVVHVTYKPLAALTLSADAHLFARPEATTPGGPTGVAGGELDLGANYALGTGLRLWGLYGLFVPHDDFYASDEALHYVEVELRYDLR
ncbi:MAG: alginate export family protein [Polyangiaceae bacterium]|nr:alginate export family protein [Polyangiaceae bacterium]